MSNEIFLRSDAKLDAAISQCNDPEEIRQLAKSHLTANGVITRERGNDYGFHLTGQGQPEAVPLPAAPQRANPVEETCIRVIYPSGNNRFEIYGVSEADLDEKERQIRAMF